MALNVGFGNTPAPVVVAKPADAVKKEEAKKPLAAAPVTDKSQPKKDEVSFMTKATKLATGPVGIAAGLGLVVVGVVLFIKNKGKGAAEVVAKGIKEVTTQATGKAEILNGMISVPAATGEVAKTVLATTGEVAKTVLATTGEVAKAVTTVII